MAVNKTGKIITVYLGYRNLTGLGVLENLSNNPNNKPDLLFLPSNCIDDRGLEMILRSSKINRVYYMDLYSNRIGDDGALAIVQSSKTNNICSLNLSRNCISASGIVALAGDLPGTKIVSLDLRFNPGSKCPQAFKALVSAASNHKILQYLQTDCASCKSDLLPVLKVNREYVSQTKKELKDLLASIKDLDELYYPTDTLDLNTLKKCEQFFCNKMLVSCVDIMNKQTVIKIQNYINNHYFKITGVVHKGLSAKLKQSASLAVLPPEVVSNITKYCAISDIRI